MNKFKETETLEFKKSLSELKEGIISIAAILNKHGSGTLWFGIKNDGKAVGLDVNEKTLRDLSQSIAAHIEPKIYPQIRARKTQGKKCIEIKFSGKEAPPYFAYGKVFMRVADEDRQLSMRELEHLILAKNNMSQHWDESPSDLSAKDIDVARLKRFLKKAGLKYDSVLNALEKLNLLTKIKNKKYLLNAAGLFFGKKQICRLRCAVFGGTGSSTIIDQHDYEGDILELIEEAQKYILKNIHIGMRLNGLYREDIPEISVEAMREAIINAFCHRDYRDPDEVRVAIFKDRVEIRNPGELYDGLTFAVMRKGNVSKRRNPLIADLLHRIHMVETWGNGMKLILAQEPGTEFQEVAKIFVASFARPSFKFKEQDQSQLALEKVSVKTSVKTSVKILELLAANPTMTMAEIASIVGKTVRAIEMASSKLIKEGKLRRIGPDKGGHWEVVK